MQDSNQITIEGIIAAHERIGPYIRRTPLFPVRSSDFGLAGVPLVLKLELFQVGGSFKARGAFESLLSQQVPAAGVVAASGGNHGVAVAYAAKRLGLVAHIFVPSVASPAKIAKIRSLGAELVVTGERYADALAESRRFAQSSGAEEVHAYDQPATLRGQGTVALEMEQQGAEVDTLLVAVGGGGLIGGIAAYLAPKIAAGTVKLVGVEPEQAPTLTWALRDGQPVDSPTDGIAADSLAPRQVGKLMFPLAQKYVSEVVLVSDPEIQAAQAALWAETRIATEPGGAAAFAALHSGRYAPKAGERIGILVCGGNTNHVTL